MIRQDRSCGETQHQFQKEKVVEEEKVEEEEEEEKEEKG